MPLEKIWGNIRMEENIISLTRIKHHYHMLSNSEKRIADYILEYHKSLGNITAQSLADATETSPATIIRFCRSVGFKGFVDFKLYLRHEFISPGANWLNISPDESVSIIKQKLFGYNKNIMDQTMSMIDDEALEQAIDLFDTAPMIAIVGEGGSGSAARATFDAFLQIGMPCIYLDDPVFQILAVARLPKGSIVCLINHSGQSKNIVDVAKFAQEKELATVGLVGTMGSPVMKFLDIALLTGIPNHPYFSDSLTARICELNVVSTIHAALSIKRRERLGDFRAEVSDLLSIKRVKR
jgi:DNA-binding MurR/RpiR family transcriptional regulator